MAQMAIAWALRNPVITSVLLGASTVEQLDENLDALDNLEFSDEELTRIDEFAVESGIDLWRRPATE
jgi:L-glyceraldehyde 3-phosphate reductase